MTTPYDFTTQSLRAQLPVFHPYQGIPWCSQDLNGKLGYTQWIWADDHTTIDVSVFATGTVDLSRHDDDEGRDGCDPTTTTP